MKSLTVYPLKSAAGHAMQQTRLWNTGLENDRRFVLVDPKGRFVSQRGLPQLALLQINLLPDAGLVLRYGSKIVALASPTGEVSSVEVWGDRVEAQDWGEAAAAFLHDVLSLDLRLFERLVDKPRQAEAAFTHGDEAPYYFADGYPLLVITQESLDKLNLKLGEKGEAPVPMDRFRPNLVIEGALPHAEDEWHRIRIGPSIELVLAKLCSRCTITMVDQSNAHSGREPLVTLAEYRRIGGKIMFGQNAYVSQGNGSTITCGDPVEVLSHI